MLDPHLVGHHEDRRRAGLRVVWHQRSSQDGGDAEELKGVRCRQAAGELFGAFGGRHEDVSHGPADHVVEHVILFLVLEELADLEERAPAGPRAAGISNHDRADPPRVQVGKRVEHYVVNDAEDRRRRADAERQGEHGQAGEAGAIAEGAESVPEVLPEGLHNAPSLVRGTSSPGPPYTLSRGAPNSPLRSRGSLAALSRCWVYFISRGTSSARPLAPSLAGAPMPRSAPAGAPSARWIDRRRAARWEIAVDGSTFRPFSTEMVPFMGQNRVNSQLPTSNSQREPFVPPG